MKRMYKVVYFDDARRQHWRFTDSFTEIKIIRDRFRIVTIVAIEALDN